MSSGPPVFIDASPLVVSTNPLMAAVIMQIIFSENLMNEQFGMRRLEDLAKRYHQLGSEQIKNKVIRAVNNFIGNKEIFDYMTLMVIKCK